MERADKVFRFTVKLVIFTLMILVCDHIFAYYVKKGLDKHYGLDKTAGIVSIGHSHSMNGIDGEALERGLNVPVAKYNLSGANTFDRLAMIKHYFSEHPNSVRAVLYDVDDHTFTSQGLGSNSYRQFYPFMDNPHVYDYVKNNAGSWEEYTSRRLLKLLRYETEAMIIGLRVMFNDNPLNNRRGKVDVAALKRSIDNGKYAKIQIDQKNVEAFEETIRYIRSQNAKIILVYIPVIDIFNDMDRNGNERITDMFKRYADKDRGVLFLNYNERYEHMHELFFDPVHLNVDGRSLVTKDLIKDLQDKL